MTRRFTRRRALRAGASLTGVALAGCLAPTTDGPLFEEDFESGLSRWEIRASIGPEVPPNEFDWRIKRSNSRAQSGEWSLEVFTEGDHDDGTAWAVTELEVVPDATRFEVALSAWSPSESFNVLRHLVAFLGPSAPTEEGHFPDPGMTSSAVPGAPYGGVREPLHLTDGWREYSFEWQPAEVPDRLFLAVGVSVVWEADATHFLDSIVVTSE